ncbi:MAG: hypothetical protein ACREJ3_06485, partial [Polyangiaceae bacterium]
MAQKILSARASDRTHRGQEAGAAEGMVTVDVDQVVLARAPMKAHAEAVAAGLKKTSVEVPIAYDGCCVTARVAAEGGRVN